MSQTVYTVITNNGDGSNSIRWIVDPLVIDKMEELADDGDETYASGDGLQLRKYEFPDGINLDNWFAINHIYLTTIEDFEEI